MNFSILGNSGENEWSNPFVNLEGTRPTVNHMCHYLDLLHLGANQGKHENFTDAAVSLKLNVTKVTQKNI